MPVVIIIPKTAPQTKRTRKQTSRAKRETGTYRTGLLCLNSCRGAALNPPQVILEAQEPSSVGLRGRRNATCGADQLNCTTAWQKNATTYDSTVYMPAIYRSLAILIECSQPLSESWRWDGLHRG